MTTSETAIRLRTGDLSLLFLDVGQDAWAQRLRLGLWDGMERVSLRLWTALAASGAGAVVDVGSFNGLYAMAAATAAPAGRPVYAFEPMPVSYGCLVMNLRLNALDGRVVAVNAALSDETGRAQISSQTGPYVMASGESLAQSWDYRTEVTTVTLADLWSQAPGSVAGWPRQRFGGPVDLVKIDVEGFEAHVVAGMGGMAPPRDVVVELLTPEAVDAFAPLWEGRSWARLYDDDDRVEFLGGRDPRGFAGGNFWLTARGRDEASALADSVTEAVAARPWTVEPLHLCSRGEGCGCP